MPLTLEELDSANNEIVYLEYRYPEYNSGYRKTSWVRSWIAHPMGINRTLYGKTWRCWLKEPTEEESRKAKWEGTL